MVLRAGFHGTVGQPSAQVIDGSLKFDSSATNYLKKIPGVAGNRRTFTISFWVKRSEGSSNEPGILSTYDGVSGPAFTCYFTSADKLRVYDDNSGYRLNLITTQLFRDYNGWYHIVISIDTTQTTTSDKAKLYVNGVRVTEFGTELYPGDINLDWNTATAHNIGRHVNAYDGNISNFYSIDGQVLGPEYFGFTDPLTNTWRPKKFEGPTSPNDGTTWSSNLTVSGGTYTIQNPGYAFDNDSYDTYADASGSGDAVYTFSPTSTIRANSSVRVFAYAASGQDTNHIKITYNNGVEVTKTAADLGLGTPGDHVWFDLSSYINFPADISSIEYSSIGGGGRLSAIEIDGILLIDGFNDPKGFGTNGFYLPFDGNSPIGQDKSSRGNDWTPVNFGGSNLLEKATGALPILNTTQGGTQATVGIRTDAYASSLVLALPLVGSKEDVSNQINSGSTTKIVTANGNVGASSASSNFYSGSFYFDGTGDYLSIADSDDLDGFNDFTIEMWINGTDVANNDVLITKGWNETSHAPYLLHFGGDGSLVLYLSSNNSSWDIVGGSTCSTATFEDKGWHHFAISRSGSNIRCFTDGVETHSFTSSTQIASNSQPLYIGAAYNAGVPMQGYIQDVRIYKGVAKYTSDFVVPATSPDILPDTPSGVSGGSKLTKITDGAVVFDGTDDYLTIPWSSDFDLGLDSDFTIEFFVNFQDDATTSTLLSWGSDIDNRFDIGCQSANTLRMFARSGGNLIINGSATISTKKWHHVAVVGYSDVGSGSSAVVLYVDGVRKFINAGALDTYAMPTDTSNSIDIGRRRYASSVSDYFGGFISNLRIVKGSAVYPYQNNITVPTEPLTNVTNTTLLCCQSNTDVTEGAVKPANVSWIPTGYTYWSGMNDNWNNTGTTTSDLSASSTGDWLDTALPSSGKYYFETIVNNPSQYRVLGISIGQSAAGAGYTDNLFGWYWNGTGTPPLFLTRTSTGHNRSGNSPNPQHGDTSELTFYDGDILMWAWDADNDKIYFGRNGTWYNNGDPAAGTGHIIEGEDLSENSHYLKVGYMNAGSGALNALTLTNVPSSNSGSSSSIESSREISNFNLVNKASNFNPFNTDIDTVRGQETTYPTMNPLAKNSAITLEDGNLRITQTDSHGQKKIVYSNAKIPNGGKWYVEWIMGGGGACTLGIGKNGKVEFRGTDTQIGTDTNSWGYEPQGNLFHNGNLGGSFGSCAAGDVIGMTIDTSGSSLTIQWYKNGVLIRNNSNTPGAQICQFTGISLDEDYIVMMSHHTPNYDTVVNFGQKPFKFPPPDGFQPLNLANARPESVIARPDQYVGVTTYTGDAPTTQSITGLNFGTNPDLVWVKNYSDATGYHHGVFDTVRGPNKVLSTSNADDEVDATQQLMSFDFNGFTVGTNSDSQNYVNLDTDGYVAWCWKAGGNKNTFNVDGVGYATTTAAGLTAGDVAPTGVSVGTKQGFSIVKWTRSSGTDTIPHGLSQAPDLIIQKSTSAAKRWQVGFSALGWDRRLYLELTNGDEDSTSFGWSGNYGPTDTLLRTGGTSYVDGDMIAYCWHNVTGLQKFGTYVGNEDTGGNGPFIELGFRPSIIMIKNTDQGTSAADWVIYDSERNKFNPSGKQLYPNRNIAEADDSSHQFDILSNGFKVRSTSTSDLTNATDKYIYCAWAEAPAVNLYGGTSNAR